jgi:hypothetical protein
MNFKASCFLWKLLFLLCIGETSAQTSYKLKGSQVDTYSNHTFKNFKMSPRQLSAFNFGITKGTDLKAQLISEGKLFNLYKLSLDNMPCFVPNKIYGDRMGVASRPIVPGMSQSDQTIPNIFRRQNIIPNSQVPR